MAAVQGANLVLMACRRDLPEMNHFIATTRGQQRSERLKLHGIHFQLSAVLDECR